MLCSSSQPGSTAASRPYCALLSRGVGLQDSSRTSASAPRPESTKLSSCQVVLLRAAPRALISTQKTRKPASAIACAALLHVCSVRRPQPTAAVATASSCYCILAGISCWLRSRALGLHRDLWRHREPRRGRFGLPRLRGVAAASGRLLCRCC